MGGQGCEGGERTVKDLLFPVGAARAVGKHLAPRLVQRLSHRAAGAAAGDTWQMFDPMSVMQGDFPC